MSHLENAVVTKLPYQTGAYQTIVIRKDTGRVAVT